MDLMADIEAEFVLAPMARVAVPTGFAIEIPPGFEGQVRPRSGLAFKQGITVMNAPGTIDADYRGEIKVLLVNLGSENRLDSSRRSNRATGDITGRSRDGRGSG